jgi:hypothetical protein
MKQYHYQRAPKKDKLKVEWMYIEAKYFEEEGILPEGLFEYKNIERLGIRGYLKAFPEDLSEKLPKLRILSVAFLGAEGLPNRIGDCHNLEELSISVTDGTLIIPASIQQLAHLKEIALRDCKLTAIPTVLTLLPTLEKLKLSNNQIKATLPKKYYWKNLQQLELYDNQLEIIPQWVLLHSQLCDLGLGCNQIKTIPEQINQLTNLQAFSIFSNRLETLPNTIAELAQLRTFSWDNNYFGYVTPTIFQLPLKTIADNKYYRSTTDLSIKNVGTIVNAMHKIFTQKEIDPKSSSLVAITAHLLNHNPAIQEVAMSDLLETYSIGTKDIKALALIEIVRRLQPFEEQQFNQTSELLILGKIIQTKTVIKNSLAPLKIKVTNKKTDNTTHVLLGKNIKKTAVLMDTNLIAINEQQFNTFIDTHAPAYLVEESESKVHHTAQLQNLLESFEVDNINIALSLMKSGGVPKELMTLIFAVNKFSTDAKIVRQSKKLLQLNASDILLEKMKKRFILKNNTQGFHPINNYLDFLCHETEINKLQLIRHAFDFTNYEYPYNNIYVSTVKELSNEEEQQAGLKYFWDCKIKNGYTRLESGDYGALEALYQRKDVSGIISHPANLLVPYYPISNLTNLHTLTLDYANRPLPLPKDFGQLAQLEQLTLVNILDFKPEAWQQLYQLPKLSSLIVETNGTPIAAGIFQFPQLKKLKLHGFKVPYDFPLGQLQTLEEIVIESRAEGDESLLFEQLDLLPNLKKVQLPPNTQANYNTYLAQKIH